MKSLAELAAIREKMQKNVILREGSGQTRVVVGHGYLRHSGGRASGA